MEQEEKKNITLTEIIENASTDLGWDKEQSELFAEQILNWVKNKGYDFNHKIELK
jgi:hypothetical protein